MQINPLLFALGMSKKSIPTKIESSPNKLELGVQGPTNGLTEALDRSCPEMDSFGPQHRTNSPTILDSYVEGPTRGFELYLDRSYPERDYRRD